MIGFWTNYLYSVLSLVHSFMIEHDRSCVRLGFFFSFSGSTWVLQKSLINIPLFSLLLLTDPPMMLHGMSTLWRFYNLFLFFW